MLRILVTGTSGYLGRRLADHFLGQGHSVLEIPGRTDFSELIAKAFSKNTFDLVLHAGFQVDFTIVDGVDIQSDNIQNALALFSAASKAEVKHFIFLSAAAVLGVSQYPIRARSEKDIAQTDKAFDFWLHTRYAREKIYCEERLREILPQNSTTLYLTTTYGKGMQENVRKSFFRLRAPWRRIIFVPAGGTSFLGIEDLFSAIDDVIRNARFGNFLVSSANLTYRDLFQAIGSGPKRLFIQVPHFLLTVFRTIFPKNAILLSSFGYKYYSPQKLIRASTQGWKPTASLEKSIQLALGL